MTAIGEFLIEKHKAKFIDGEWVPYGKPVEERTVKNYLYSGLHHNQNGGDVTYCVIKEVGFTLNDQHRILISSFKQLTKNQRIDTGSITADTTSEDPYKFIEGSYVSGKETPELVEGTTNIITTIATWSPPATASREIWSIMNYGSSNNQYNNIALSTVTLDSPCLQETNEVLTIRHRYTYVPDDIKNTITNLPEEFKTYFSKKLPLNSGYELPITNYVSKVWGSGNSSNIRRIMTDSLITIPGHTVTSKNFSEGYLEGQISVGTSEYVGCLLNDLKLAPSNTWRDSMLEVDHPDYGYYGYNYNVSVPLRRIGDTAVQNSFPKKPHSDPTTLAKSPFLDLDNVVVGTGTCTLSDDFISGDTSYESIQHLAGLYRVQYTQGGAMSNAKYKISKRLVSGYQSATKWAGYASAPIVTTPNGSNASTVNLEKVSPHEFTNSNFDVVVVPSELPEFFILTRDDVDADVDGLWLYNINDPDNFPVKLNAVSLPAFTATDIRSVVSTDEGITFVACAATGLWKLTRDVDSPVGTTTVELITNTGAAVDTVCQAVNFARPLGHLTSNHRLWALFGADLCYSDDLGTNWVALNAGTSPQWVHSFNNVDRVIGMICDYNHVDNRIGFLESNDFTDFHNGTQQSTFMCSWSVGGSGITSDFVRNTSFTTMYAYVGVGNRGLVPIQGTDYWKISKSNNAYTWGATSGSTSPNYAATKYFDAIDNVVTGETYLGVIYHSNDTNRLGTNTGYAYIDASNFYTGPWGDIKVRLHKGASNSPKHWRAGVHMGYGVFYVGALNSSNTHNVYGTDAEGYFPRLLGFGSDMIGPTSELDWSVGNPLSIWAEYGWDGSKWVRGHAGDRVVHDTTEPMIDGLHITFAEDPGNVGGADNFLINEFVDTYVYDGIVKDDLTAFSFDYTVYHGDSFVGVGCTPAAVPANGLGNITIPLAVEGYDEIGTDSITVSTVAFDRDYIGCGGNAGGSNKPSANMGPTLSDDFTITFRADADRYDLSDVSFGASDLAPKFGLIDRTKVASGHGAKPDMGFVVIPDIANPDEADFIFTETTGTQTTVHVMDYHPLTDTLGFARVGSNITFTRNGGTIHTFVGTGVALKAVWYSEGYNAVGVNIFDAQLTFNDTRLVAKVGNGVDSGAWDINFSRLNIHEFEKGSRKVTLDGIQAAVHTNDGISEPAPGEVVINRGTGEIIFNAADAGKVIDVSWRCHSVVNSRK